MSNFDYNAKRIDRNKARKMVARIAQMGPERAEFSHHARIEMAKDGLLEADIREVLKSPLAQIWSEGEYERGSFRYRLETRFIMVVISFTSSGEDLVVVTVWNKQKQ